MPRAYIQFWKRGDKQVTSENDKEREAFDDERMEHVTSKFQNEKEKKERGKERNEVEREKETEWKKNYTTVIARLS